MNTESGTDTTVPQSIKLLGGPACGTLMTAPEGWPNVPHVEVPLYGAKLYYAPDPDCEHTATFVCQQGNMTVPDSDAA